MLLIFTECLFHFIIFVITFRWSTHENKHLQFSSCHPLLPKPFSLSNLIPYNMWRVLFTYIYHTHSKYGSQGLSMLEHSGTFSASVGTALTSSAEPRVTANVTRGVEEIINRYVEVHGGTLCGRRS